MLQRYAIRFTWTLLFVGLLQLPSVAKDEPNVRFDVDMLKQLEQDVEAMVKRALPCTVCIQSARGQGSGSGVIVSEDGLILTAAHVTAAAGEDLVVIFPNGRRVKAKRLGSHRGRDAGMAKILGDEKFPFAKVGQSKSLKRNDWCIAIGHASGFDPKRSPPIRLGRVLNNGYFIATDCTLIGGDSGGPLFDLQGRVIGIHSNIGGTLSQNNHVPVDVFNAGWERMKSGKNWGGRLGGPPENPNRPVLGVQLDMRAQVEGALVDEVTDDSPAAKAGFVPGDVVTAVGETKIESPNQMIATVSKMKSGKEVTFTISRGGEQKTLTAKLVRLGDLYGEEDVPNTSPKNKDDEDDTPSKKEGGDKTEPSDDKDDKDLDIDELIRRARENGGRMDLTPEQMRQFRKQMQQRMTERFGGGLLGPAEDKWADALFAAYQPIVGPASKGVYPVVVRNRQVALATAIAQEGRLLTKASEVEDVNFRVVIGEGKRVPAKIVKTLPNFDLAVIEVEGHKLEPVAWSNESDPVELGSFVASVGNRKLPEGIGVVSVLPRKLKASGRGYLGVMLTEANDGVRIRDVNRGSPAHRAGLKRFDLVTKVNDTEVASPEEMIKAVTAAKPGQRVTFEITRDDKELKKTVKLGDRSAMQFGREAAMNQMGGPLSNTRVGFESVLQHDCPIDPNDCGGPVVDLDGRILGINIARAGRIKSYAIPIDLIRPKLAEKKE